MRAKIATSVLAAWLVLAMAGPTFGHAHLSSAMPAPGATVKAPAEIRLLFTEPLEPAFSTIEVYDAAGKRIQTGKSEVKDNIMHVPLKPLPAGGYKVNWRVLSVDTHKSSGSFTFTVAP
jgi:methionine-rich copper-binding protein CopC